MRPRLLTETARLALILMLAVGGVSYWLLDAPFGALTHHPAATARTSEPSAPARHRRPAATAPPAPLDAAPTAHPGAGARTGGHPHMLSLAERIVRWLLAALLVAFAVAILGCVAALGLALPRLRARAARARSRERYEIIPYRTDVASPERMVQVYQALAATLNRRWFRRILTGAPSLAFEIHVLPQRDRPARAVLSVVCAAEDALLIDSCLQIAYPDARVGFEFTLAPRAAADSPTWTQHVKRVKKLRPFIAQVGVEGSGSRAFEHQLTDALLVNLAQVTAPVTVQLSLTPAPRWVDRLAGREYREEERRVASAREHGELGERSPRTDADLRGGLAAQHQLLFYFDIRCASSDARVALHAAQSLCQDAGVNRLRVKEPWLLERLHARRIEKGVPRLLAPIRHGVLSSRELAVLWQLPTNRPRSVSVRRSNLLREPASARVWRPNDPADAFADDERGPVGIHPSDRKLGVRFTGVPGVGKTSGMVALWSSDVRDRDAVCIALDPKTEAAEEMLSQVPAGRNVYWLDLARPEFGMSPLLMQASMEVIGDTVVESLRDINEEGAIMAASDRYLRSATYGALLLAAEEERMPSWYDVYQQLWPEDTGAELRQRVSELCQADPDLAGLRALWGTVLPSMLKDSRSQVVVRMDAPGNKLARLLGQPTLARMLHHPMQVSIDQVIEERAVLIVQAGMGAIGEENAVIMLRFLLRMIHTALQREQGKPAHLRPRKCLYIDEAHYLWGGVLEVMLSTGRSARLEPVLAWQHSGQIEELRMAKGVLADLQTTINFRCGDPDEAEQVARQAMIAYLTRYSGEQSDRDNARFTPAEQLKLSRYFALAIPIVEGEADKPYLLRTHAMRKDIERVEHHLQAQRARGFYYPESMPDPLPNTRADSQRDDGAVPDRTPAAANSEQSTPPDPSAPAPEESSGPAEAVPAERREPPKKRSAGTGGVRQEPERPALPAPGPAARSAPAASAQKPTPKQAPPKRSPAAPPEPEGERESAPPASAGAAPASFTELDFGDVRQIVWDRRRTLPPPPDEQPEWKPDDVQALSMLHRFGPLMITQIGRHVWPGRTERTVQRKMEAFFRSGLVNRFHMATPTRHPYIYTLTEEGFRVARDGPNDDPRNYLDPTVKFTAANDELPDPKPADSKWRESELKSGLYVLHNLHAAGWSLAGAAALGDACKRIHGGRESSCALRPPRGVATRADVAIRGNRSVGDLQLEQFSAIWADARLDVHVAAHHMTHWYVECDRTGRPSKNSKKFSAYDAMFCGWGQMLGAYQQHLPIVVFVCMDERSVLAHLLAADRALTGWVAGLVGKLEDRVYIGRQRTWFVNEIDAHAGSLRAWRLPDLPPGTRTAAGLPEKMRPVIKHLVPPERLGTTASRPRARTRQQQPA
jgi:hypothetical protein